MIAARSRPAASDTSATRSDEGSGSTYAGLRTPGPYARPTTEAEATLSVVAADTVPRDGRDEDRQDPTVRAVTCLLARAGFR